MQKKQWWRYLPAQHNRRMIDSVKEILKGRVAPVQLLFLGVVLIWGLSWYGIRLQLGVVPVQLSVAYRFIIAAILLFTFCLISGRSLRFRLRDHFFMALQGFCIFSMNFQLFYHAYAYISSGVGAVIFSIILIMNIINAALFFGRSIEARVIFGGLIGLTGLGLVYWPEMEGLAFGEGALTGLGLALAATYLASLGSVLALRHAKQDIPIIQSNAYGMAYGAVWSLLLAKATGLPLWQIDGSWSYLGSLLYLSFFASIIGFGCYLSLVQRIGAGRAAYALLLSPLVALLMSTLFEGYHWTLPAAFGVTLILGSNLFVLRRASECSPLFPITPYRLWRLFRR